MYRVCVYAIAKNESRFADRWVDSVGEADLIVVTDTGSTDDTVERLRARGVRVYEYPMEHFRFDEARNVCLAHVPEDVDICVAPDLDDIIEPGWRKKLEAAWGPGVTRGQYLYNWSFLSDGTPAVQYIHQRVHSRQGYRWLFPTHEVLEYTGDGPEKSVFIPGMVYNHHPDSDKDRRFNLELLELAVREHPMSARNLHYLGREYLFAGRWQDAVDTLERYLALPDATWREERSAAMRFLGRACHALGRGREAATWFLRSVAEDPGAREPLIELAWLAYVERDWPAVYHWADEALKITHKALTYANESFAWDSTPWDLAALGCYHLGLYERATEFSRGALALNPGDERLQRNHEAYLKRLSDGHQIE